MFKKGDIVVLNGCPYDEQISSELKKYIALKGMEQKVFEIRKVSANQWIKTDLESNWIDSAWYKKVEKEKTLYEYKLGEIVNKPLMNGMLKPPIKLVKISYTFQTKNGTQMDVVTKHDDFKQIDEDDS